MENFKGKICLLKGGNITVGKDKKIYVRILDVPFVSSNEEYQGLEKILLVLGITKDKVGNLEVIIKPGEGVRDIRYKCIKEIGFTTRMHGISIGIGFYGFEISFERQIKKEDFPFLSNIFYGEDYLKIVLKNDNGTYLLPLIIVREPSTKNSESSIYIEVNSERYVGIIPEKEELVKLFEIGRSREIYKKGMGKEMIVGI